MDKRASGLHLNRIWSVRPSVEGSKVVRSAVGSHHSVGVTTTAWSDMLLQRRLTRPN
jgi:hypothetical protein